MKVSRAISDTFTSTETNGFDMYPSRWSTSGSIVKYLSNSDITLEKFGLEKSPIMSNDESRDDHGRAK